MGSYQNIKDYRVRLKERAVYVLGGKCQCCGYNKCIQALDFHHLNPEEKEFGIGTNTNRSWESTREEIKKCALVCANCHREIHANLIDNNTLTSPYDEVKANEITELVENTKTHKIYYCHYCGAVVSSGNNCCVNCANIVKRKVERPSREELKQLIYDMPFTQIGEMYQVTDNTVRKWCKRYNLPSKRQEINSYSKEDWEEI